MLDMKMPGLDGMEVVDAVTRDELPTRVLLLSAFLDSGLAYRALGAGPAGYLSKDSTGERICDAIVAVSRGSRAAAVRAGHIGLASCAERVELAGGRLNIESTPGQGTTVTARLPATRRA